MVVRTGAEHEPPAAAVREVTRELISLHGAIRHGCVKERKAGGEITSGSSTDRVPLGRRVSVDKLSSGATWHGALTGSFAFSRVRMAWNMARGGTFLVSHPRLSVSTACRTASSARRARAKGLQRGFCRAGATTYGVRSGVGCRGGESGVGGFET